MPDDIKQLKREIRKLRESLRDLTVTSVMVSAGIDHAMKGPSTVERGERLGALGSCLDMATDRAMRFTLNYSFPKIRRGRTNAAKRAEQFIEGLMREQR